ncbi:uncharacterized protein LOC121259494 [Juglans microcarpa x Juglans regia]|uniref:uncharacterized protein LOC121259494 n=1 Tax=Juglans microcarpa x Juglans regia TaxID=2249226 RepID=UPI001B7EE7A6|nr:uncharacterized protein LOC121259494 [Juglans microcarpa x Juglans regia]
MDQIQHFSHRHHPLTLVLLNEVDGDLGRCKICYETIKRVSDDGYGCKECGFYIHKSCAVFPYELQHPSHPKHLLLLELHSRERCANCSSYWFEFKYKCPYCHEFYLCPECAFLPLTKKAENHDHPLNLMQKLLPFTCDHCLEKGNSMPYFCSTCSYMIHSKCTSLPLIVQSSTIQAAIHCHPLTFMPALSISLTCDACGNEIKGRFYFCATCSFVAHLNCAHSPSIVKVIRHKHPLNLIYSLPADQSKRRVVCQLCAKTVDTNYWLYCCSSHDFVAHLHCATKKEEIDETFVPNSKQDHNDKSMDLLPAYIVKKTKSEGDGTEIQTEIKHFSHEHDLKLIDGLGIDKKCNGCIRSIFPPFYACAQCEFSLHKSCAELSRELRNSLHRHPSSSAQDQNKIGDLSVVLVCVSVTASIIVVKNAILTLMSNAV